MAPPTSAPSLRPQGRPGVALAELFGAAATPAGHAAAIVAGITLDSRLVSPGDLYVALPGSRHHGAQFAAAAAAAGASAVLTDRSGGELAGASGLPVVVVDDPRRAMAEAAAEIYGRPAEQLAMYAVTGTNGKTTTTFLLEAALRHAGVRTGVIGTVGFRLDGADLGGRRTTITTPESTELQALLGYLVEQGAQAAVMEVSSHALVVGRVDPIIFDVAGFTNLGRDHLDFHGDLDSYFEAKARLFTAERTRHAVINVDDPRGVVLAERVQRAGLGLTTLSLDGPADCFATAYAAGPDGRTVVTARLPSRSVDFSLSLPGDFNVRNALTALAMVDALGGDVTAAAAGLADAQVPGRMQRVDLGAGAPTVYVDFAHTPQAVSAALDAVRGVRRIAVLGCGGERDPAKRGPMGAAAARSAEVVVVTDDNPRSEDPAAIRAAVLAGAVEAVRSERLASRVIDGGDRRAAIRLALSLAGPGEVVEILGKGHESGQEIGGRTLPFSDADVAATEWLALSGGSPAVEVDR